MNLALACDVRIAARRPASTPASSRSASIPVAAIRGCCNVAGPQVAAAVLFGEVLDGAEAERVGLALRCVDDDVLAAAAQEMAARAASAPRELAIETKRTIVAMAALATHEEAVDREVEPAGLVDPPAVVRGTHRGPAGEDQQEVLTVRPGGRATLRSARAGGPSVNP